MEMTPLELLTRLTPDNLMQFMQEAQLILLNPPVGFMVNGIPYGAGNVGIGYNTVSVDLGDGVPRPLPLLFFQLEDQATQAFVYPEGWPQAVHYRVDAEQRFIEVVVTEDPTTPVQWFFSAL